MIYLLDKFGPHAELLKSIIKQHTKEDVVHIELSFDLEHLSRLFESVKSSDIVLCPWTIDPNLTIDDFMTGLSKKCFVIAAAGNSSTEIENYSPTRAEGIIVVGALNKSGNRASMSNYSMSKELEWLPGTNYEVNGQYISGTSVSAALYSAFLAEALIAKNPQLLENLIKQSIVAAQGSINT